MQKGPESQGFFAKIFVRRRWDLNSSFQITWQSLGSFRLRFAGISRHVDDDASRENVASCCHFVAAHRGLMVLKAVFRTAFDIALGGLADASQ